MTLFFAWGSAFAPLAKCVGDSLKLGPIMQGVLIRGWEQFDPRPSLLGLIHVTHSSSRNKL